MKQLTCEMCGSTDVMKQEGIFVCQVCGCKYTIEEARKLLLEVDGVVNVQGTVQVDRSVEINNRLENALAEYEASNHERAAAMFNDILNIDYENTTAIIYKAASDGWQLSLKDNHISQISHEMCRAIKIARKKNEDDIAFLTAILPAIVEFRKISNAFKVTCERRFKEVEQKVSALRFEAEEAKKRTRGLVSYAESMKYGNKAKRCLKQMNELIDRESTLIGTNIIKVRNSMEELANLVMDFACEMESLSTSFVESMESFEDVYLNWKNHDSKDQLKIRIRLEEAKQRIDKVKEKQKQQRLKAFWEQNQELKQTLEIEQASLLAHKAELENKISSLDQEIDDISQKQKQPVPAESERDECKAQRSAVTKRLEELNIFQRKEKKQQEELHNHLSSRLAELDALIMHQKKEQQADLNKAMEPYKEERSRLYTELESINKRLREIQQEFTSDR